jgi:hypothetical protein
MATTWLIAAVATNPTTRRPDNQGISWSLVIASLGSDVAPHRKPRPCNNHGRRLPCLRVQRNGSRNGRETLEPLASASPIGHPLSWEIPLVSDKEPKRVGPAGARVPETPFSPRLYHAPCARVHPRAPMCTKIQGGTLVLGVPQNLSQNYFLTHNFRIHVHWTIGDVSGGEHGVSSTG